MRYTALSRSTRRAMGVVALALGATVLPAHAASAHLDDDRGSDPAHGRTVIRGFDDAQATVTLGRTLSDRVVVTPRARRTVLVQVRGAGAEHFTTQSRGHSTATGAFKATYSPTSAGTWRYRLVVLPGAGRRQAVSDTRVIRTVDLTAPGAVRELRAEVTTSTAKLSWENPRDKDFAGVTVRRAVGTAAPASQVAGTPVTSTSGDETTFTDAGLDVDQWYSYALFARDDSGNFSRAAVVTLRTGRFGVTHLEAAQVKRTSVTLAWTNPIDDAFAGVIIRRADGTTPPASDTAGTPVADVDASEDSFTDTGLTPGTTYSYAVFAHDATGHVAAGLSATVTTRSNGVSAVLAVNPLPSVHSGDRVTVDTPVAFDGADSLPAVGADLVAWEISFGDSTSEVYSGPLGRFDVLNTRHTFTETGPHTVRLTVTDSKGNTDSTSLTVDVLEAPTVSISTSDAPAAGTVPIDVQVETPDDTAITSYRLAVAGADSFFVNGRGAPPRSLDLDLARGSYTVVLSVTDDAGATAASESLDVEVS